MRGRGARRRAGVPRRARRRRRPHRARRARARLRDGGQRGRVDRHAGRRAGGAAAQGDPLRPRRRPALRLHLGLDQGDARVGSRRRPVLPRGHARGRRGRALHGPADGDLRLRGHRQRRPAGARRGDRGGRRRRACRHARGRPRALAGDDLPRARAEVQGRDDLDRQGDPPRPRARRGRAAAADPLASGRLRQPAQPPRPRLAAGGRARRGRRRALLRARRDGGRAAGAAEDIRRRRGRA